MQENAIFAELGDLKLSAVLFDEAFRLYTNKPPTPPPLNPPHRHADYEIFFLLEGTLTLQSEEGILQAKSPAVLILPPFFDHVTKYDVAHGYCMYFNLERKPKATGTLYKKVADTLSRNITVMPLEEEPRFYIEQLAKTISTPSPEGKERHLVALLFSELFQSMIGTASPAEQSKHTRYINGIDLFLSEHYREKIRLTDLAKTLHLCPKQISRIIRKKYGCSFSDRVRDHRLALARTMLETSEDSITTIAEAVGYEYANYFYTLFRKTYGMTPQEYRQKHRIKSADTSG